tara:strand:- start:8495 stop:8686 length:192 start_codon:yes stop_codon:yes gene_type:complete
MSRKSKACHRALAIIACYGVILLVIADLTGCDVMAMVIVAVTLGGLGLTAFCCTVDCACRYGD